MANLPGIAIFLKLTGPKHFYFGMLGGRNFKIAGIFE
jgi:hypothetical protein